MLIAENIVKRFGKKTALHSASFCLKQGVTGLLGPNGAGKTTLMRILATYYMPNEGSLRLNEVKWETKFLEQIRSEIGYLPQHTGVFPQLRAAEYLEYIGILRGMDKKILKELIKEVLTEVNLEERAKDKISSFSGGMKQRLGIAQAILHDPQLLLIDEPTAGLDPEERIRFRNLVRQLAYSRIVLLSTHITEDITATCDQILLMKKGIVEVHEHVQSVISYANGKVWQVELERPQFEKLKKDNTIVITNITETANGSLSVRAIAEHPQQELNKQGLQVSPSLEEGYMVWLGKS